MKKCMLAILIIGAFVLFSFLSHNATTSALPPNNTSDPGTSLVPSPTSDVAATGTADPPTTPETSNTAYKDGTYTGSVADAQWGNIQVQVVIQQGKLTNITFLQYPNERTRSVMINHYADPQLVSEAIQVQSAEVDIVTGATDTSEAFMQSLSDALSQAQG